CRLAFFLDALLALLPCFGHGLLDPGRVDATVDDQLVQSGPGHLAADRIEAADHDRFRSVVDDQVDSGRLLERADVAPLTADNSALDLLVGKREDRDRCLGRLVGGALDRHGANRASPARASVTSRQLGLPHSASDFVSEVLLDLSDQDPLSFLTGHVGGPFELPELLLCGVFEFRPELIDTLLPLSDRLLAPTQVCDSTLEGLFFLMQAV